MGSDFHPKSNDSSIKMDFCHNWWQFCEMIWLSKNTPKDKVLPFRMVSQYCKVLLARICGSLSRNYEAATRLKII